MCRLVQSGSCLSCCWEFGTAVFAESTLRRSYVGLFALSVSLWVTAFYLFEGVFSQFYLYPMSVVAAWILNLLGVATQLDSGQLGSGYCLLIMNTQVFRVIHECTGVFTLLILLGAIAAHRESLHRRAVGILLSILVFFTYGAMRLVVLGVASQMFPDLLDVLHVWLLALMNLVMAALLWLVWLDCLSRRP